MMNTSQSLAKYAMDFFKPGRVYAVAGASSNPSKFGHKVLNWYLNRSLPVTPINFRREIILGQQSVENISEVKPGDDGISLSVVTPPAVSLDILKQIEDAKLNVKAVWFQPGTFDSQVVEQARQIIPTVIKDCVLVNGDKYLDLAKL